VANVGARSSLDSAVILLVNALDVHGGGGPDDLGELGLAIGELSDTLGDDHVAHVRSTGESSGLLVHVEREVGAALDESLLNETGSEGLGEVKSEKGED
jgi:hypothetical protein